jgi:xylan 1,4-beta-xylosidase
MGNAQEFTLHCSQVAGSAPRLPHAVMGFTQYNLLMTGGRLQRTLEEIGETPLLRRTMGTLCSGYGIDRGFNVYSEDAQGNPVHDFTMLDQVLDVMVSPRSIPFFGLSFMPDDLSSGSPKKLTKPWMKIDRFPPKDYQRWYDLIYAVVRHAVERYGEENVRGWYWDFWNEPDLEFYWLGTHEEFLKTYDYTAAAVKAALPGARVGGPGVTDRKAPIFREFLEHCTSGKNYFTGEVGAPLDFITCHTKGGPTGKLGVFTDPWNATDYEKRSPSLTHMLETVRWFLETIASVPGTEGLPVFLTECDIDWGTSTSIYHNPNMHYRNNEYFPAFQCAITADLLDLAMEFPDNPLQGAFLDTFYFPGYRLFEGQRTLITAEVVDKPILNGLRLLGKLGPERLAASPQGTKPVRVLGTRREDGSLQVMAVNFGEDTGYAESHSVRVNLADLPKQSWRVSHYRIDRDHSNAHTIWEKLGRPLTPSAEQLAAIQERMGLERCEPDFTLEQEGAFLTADLPPQSVSLWVLDRR